MNAKARESMVVHAMLLFISSSVAQTNHKSIDQISWFIFFSRLLGRRFNFINNFFYVCVWSTSRATGECVCVNLIESRFFFFSKSNLIGRQLRHTNEILLKFGYELWSNGIYSIPFKYWFSLCSCLGAGWYSQQQQHRQHWRWRRSNSRYLQTEKKKRKEKTPKIWKFSPLSDFAVGNNV